MWRRIQLVTGVVGASLSATFVWLWWKVVSSPGDDNPIGLLFLFGAAVCVVPALGVIAWRKTLGGVWFLCSVLILLVAVPFAWQFL